MSIELILATFDDEPENVRVPAILRRLADVMRGSLRKARVSDVGIDVTDEQVLVDLPGGTARIHADYAFFPIVDLDPLTLRVIFDVAVSGDMVVLTEGGDYEAIVMNSSQRTHLPEEDWQSEQASPLCRSPAELERLLQSCFRMHANYRDQMIADWTAGSPPNLEVPAPSPEVKQYRWDPVENEVVEITKEPEEIWLYRFDAAGNEIPKHPSVLNELEDICRLHMEAERDSHSQFVDNEEWPPLSLRFPYYSSDVWPARAEFDFDDLTPAIARLMFEVSRAGDMSIILPRVVIVTDRGQRERVPESWKQTMKIITCESAEELSPLLMTWQIDIPLAERDYGCGEKREHVPGTYPQRARCVYIEAKPNETALEQQKKVYKHKSQSPDGPQRPDSGLLLARFWQLETPAGQRFFAYQYAPEGWLALLREFRPARGRRDRQLRNVCAG